MKWNRCTVQHCVSVHNQGHLDKQQNLSLSKHAYLHKSLFTRNLYKHKRMCEVITVGLTNDSWLLRQPSVYKVLLRFNSRALALACRARYTPWVISKQEDHLMLTNLRDAFVGQSMSPNMVPFHMLHIVSYCAIATLCLRPAVFMIFDFKMSWPWKPGQSSFKVIERGSIR